MFSESAIVSGINESTIKQYQQLMHDVNNEILDSKKKTFPKPEEICILKSIPGIKEDCNKLQKVPFKWTCNNVVKREELDPSTRGQVDSIHL